MVRASLISQQMCHRSGVGHDEGVLQYGSRDVHSKNSYSGRYNQKKLAGWHCHFPIYAWASNLGIGRHAMTVGLPVTAS